MTWFESESQDDDWYDVQEKELRLMYGDVIRLQINSKDDCVCCCPVRTGVWVEWCKRGCEKFIKINESYVYCRR